MEITFDGEKVPAKEGENVPATIFNLAWYKELSGDRQAARELLRPLVALGVNPKYKEFQDLIGRGAPGRARGGGDTRKGPRTGFWRNGMAGLCGARKAWWTKTLAVIVFLVSVLIVFAICVGIGSVSASKGSGTFWAYLFLGGFWYILFWGLPLGGWGWTWAVIVTLFFAGAVAIIAES